MEFWAWGSRSCRGPHCGVVMLVVVLGSQKRLWSRLVDGDYNTYVSRLPMV
jgi:hypothetical protein